MTPDELVEGEEYVISLDVEKNGKEHPQLDPGDLVTLVNGKPDSDGEVYVTATAVEDEATIGAWVKTDYLITKEEAQRWVDEHMEDDEARSVPSEFSYIPHPDYPTLPTFETLPLGYALGVMAYFSGAQRAMLRGF